METERQGLQLCQSMCEFQENVGRRQKKGKEKKKQCTIKNHERKEKALIHLFSDKRGEHPLIKHHCPVISTRREGEDDDDIVDEDDGNTHIYIYREGERKRLETSLPRYIQKKKKKKKKGKKEDNDEEMDRTVWIRNSHVPRGVVEDSSEPQPQPQTAKEEEKESELASELKKAMQERKDKEENNNNNFLSGVAQEITQIEWPPFPKVFSTSAVVLAVIFGSTVVLLSLNAVFAELSDRVFAARGLQDFFT
ncbi:hypothetical protein Lal_00027597 [Lupinus albus]|nr:hypothetical protein Lal_00027597 [Lupinus albus]